MVKMSGKLVGILAFLVIVLLFAVPVRAHDVIIDGFVDGQDQYVEESKSYMSDKSKGISLAAYTLDDCMGLDKTHDDWVDYSDSFYEAFWTSHVADEVFTLYAMHDLVVDYGNGDSSTQDLLAAQGMNIIETKVGVPHLQHYQRVTSKVAQKMIDSGVELCDATKDFVHMFTDVLFPSDDLYRIDNVDEKTQQKYKSDVVYLVTAGDATRGIKPSIEVYKGKDSKTENKKSKEENTQKKVEGGGSAQGNGGSIDHSDGISEEELINELSYLDSLGLSDEEFNQQLEIWAAEHGEN